jgi:hypothetical protein
MWALTSALGFACKPIKVSSDKSQAMEACPTGSIDASGYCVKDGTIHLLRDIRLAEGSSSATVNNLSFGKQSFLKGDKIYAFGRFSFPKSGTGTSQTLGFQLGDLAIGSSTTQFVGDQDNGIMVSRTALAHEFSEAVETILSLKSMGGQDALKSGSDGVLLLFRAARISEVTELASKDPASASYYVTDTIDTDNILSPDIKVGENPSVLKVALASSMKNDASLIRAGFSWEPASGKTAACDGVSVTWHLIADETKIMSEGPYFVGQNQLMGSAVLQAIVRGQDADLQKGVSIGATINGEGRSDCVLKVTEPSTLSVIVFRPASELLTDIQGARYLHRMGSVSAPIKRLATNSGGPPIETVLQFNWDHLRSDSLVTDIYLGAASEDRVKPSKLFVQLSRAPDSLSSHLGKVMLKSPDKNRTMTLFDLATENNLNTQTRFYLTAMGFNDDSKPINLNESQIHFLHFRRVSDQL